MDLNEIYKIILANAGMQADDEGFVSMVDQNEPVLLAGKRLVLPTRNQLAQPNLGNRVVFHPLHESLIRGESDVMTRTRELISARLNISFSYITLCLLTLATSPAQHVSLAPDQTLFLDALKDIDEDIVDTYSKILQAMSVSQDGKSFLRIFVKRGGKYKGRTVQRLAVVSFPFYEELIKRPAAGQPNMVYGVRIKKAHRECLINLIEYMVPNINVDEHYNRGSDSTVAPTLDAVMQATRALGGLVNEMCDLFGEKIIPDLDSMKYPMDWVETFDNLPGYQARISLVPSQPGNEGKMPGSDRVTTEVPLSDVKITPREPAPWDGPSELPASAPTPAEPPPVTDTIFGPPKTAPARPTLGVPTGRVVNHPVPQAPVATYGQVQQRQSFTPGVIGQSHNRFLPNYVPPAGPQVGYGQHPYAAQGYGQPQAPRRHVPSWAGGGTPGYSNGYGNNGGGGGTGFGNI